MTKVKTAVQKEVFDSVLQTGTDDRTSTYLQEQIDFLSPDGV